MATCSGPFCSFSGKNVLKKPHTFYCMSAIKLTLICIKTSLAMSADDSVNNTLVTATNQEVECYAVKTAG